MKIISFNLSLNAHTNDHQTQSPIDLSHHAHTELSGRRRSKQKNGKENETTPVKKHKTRCNFYYSQDVCKRRGNVKVNNFPFRSADDNRNANWRYQ